MRVFQFKLSTSLYSAQLKVGHINEETLMGLKPKILSVLHHFRWLNFSVYTLKGIFKIQHVIKQSRYIILINFQLKITCISNLPNPRFLANCHCYHWLILLQINQIWYFFIWFDPCCFLKHCIWSLTTKVLQFSHMYSNSILPHHWRPTNWDRLERVDANCHKN